MQMVPLVSYSVASRCRCGICGKTPQVTAAGTNPVEITARCCGKVETKSVPREELTYTQVFFVPPATK